jgi:uncharacterized protein YjgD (DUF1641 family)
MAKATKVIHRIQPSEEALRKQDLQEIEEALIENKDAIIETLELMQQIQGTELPGILKALVAEREEVLEEIVTFMDGSDITRSLSNAMQLFTVLGQFNFEEMEPLVEKLNAGLSEVARTSDKIGGYPALLQAISDPDVIEGLNTGLAFAKGLGSTETEDSKKKTEQENEGNSSGTKWIAAVAAGVSLIALPFMFKRK